MSGPSKPIKIIIKSKHPDDAERALKAVAEAFASRRSRELQVTLEDTASEPPAVQGGVPDEPRETDLAADARKHLGERREKMRDRGEDPDKPRPATPEEVIARRERAREFRTWFAKTFIGHTIRVVVTWGARVFG